jgi:hypothetical protein
MQTDSDSGVIFVLVAIMFLFYFYVFKMLLSEDHLPVGKPLKSLEKSPLTMLCLTHAP